MLRKPARTAASTNRNVVFLSDFRAAPRGGTGLEETDFVIVGCGGLGSGIAARLAAAGARHFFLVDNGRIDDGNLKRLSWAAAEDIGEPKADRLASYLASRFSASVVTLPEAAEELEAVRLVMAHVRRPFLIFAVDDARLGRRLVAACHAALPEPPPYLYVGPVGARSVVGPLVAGPDDPCPFCSSATDAAGDGEVPASDLPADKAPIAGLVISQIACQRFTHPNALRGKRWWFDPRTGRAELRSVSKRPDCEVCNP
ncbi:ThiF family adenylyltransferase [Rhizobium puerariae]|uniref:ThiF family adenylyltransferase n=1 Tax=Rhizobium puerariae TaxID=1585791 RepID=A0ABV6AC83_9HYPH